jgi:hypothetical protein
MPGEPTIDPEMQARRAQDLYAFRQVNLLGIKGAVAELLGQIGRDGIFREYTIHDINWTLAKKLSHRGCI